MQMRANKIKLFLLFFYDIVHRLRSNSLSMCIRITKNLYRENKCFSLFVH